MAQVCMYVRIVFCLLGFGIMMYYLYDFSRHELLVRILFNLYSSLTSLVDVC